MRLFVATRDDALAAELAIVVRWHEPILSLGVEVPAPPEVVRFTGAEPLLDALGQSPPALSLLDLDLDLGDGSLLARAVATCPTPLVALSAGPSVDQAVRAVQAGAHDYLACPLDPVRVATAVRSALRLAATVDAARLAATSRLLGSSGPMRELRARLRRLASTRAPALLLGASGTGKDLAARALHDAREAEAPFVSRAAAVLDGGGLERASSEAHGGTLYLDRIDELPREVQAEARAALDDPALRVVASALSHDTVRDTLQPELYHRLAATIIELPPLSARGEDLSLLARHFAARAAQLHARPTVELSELALHALARYAWPGNVRELEHAVDRAVLLGAVEELERVGREGDASPDPWDLVRAVESLERDMIVRALRAHGGVKAQAARALSITPRMIRYKMMQLGIEHEGAD